MLIEQNYNWKSYSLIYLFHLFVCKAFFALQSPNDPDPPGKDRIAARKKNPNWKVKPLLEWMNIIFKLVWLLGSSFSIDKMTMGFQGMHADKKRIMYKNKGDGFQCNAFCQTGYTYQFYMRNDPAPETYLKQG